MAIDINVKVTLEGGALADAMQKLAEALCTPVTFAGTAPAAPQEGITFKPEDVVKVGAVNPTPEAVKAPESAPVMPQQAIPAPVQTAPVAPAVQAMPQPVAQAVPEAPAPQPVAPQPTAQVAPAQGITRQALNARCVALVQSKPAIMPQMTQMLQKYGVVGLPQLPEEYIAAFWADLDAMGV